jgi:cytoplasmic FMR1 interacting protein
MDLLHAAPFQNIIPRPFAKSLHIDYATLMTKLLMIIEPEEQEVKLKRLEQKYSKIQIADAIGRLGNLKVR